MSLQEQCEINELNYDYSNAFFQMVIQPSGVFIKYFPHKNGGMPLNIEEFRDYMSKQKLIFDPSEFSKLIFSAKEPVLMKTGNLSLNPVPEIMNLKIKENGLLAVCRFIPASNGGTLLSKEDILLTLERNGIKFGLDQKEIDLFLSKRMYGTDYCFARGVEPINGTDGSISYRVDTKKSVKPTVREDGSVDFFHLNIIPKVEKGEIIADLVKEVEGVPGMDVKGKVLPALKVTRLQVRLGANVSISENGCQILSNVSGHLVIEEDKISVSNTYTVNGDVDTTTGNLSYDGNLEIMGNVISGYQVEATGDILINGTVEGATIIAGGHIILKNGIKGMGKGSLRSGGNIVSRYLESVEVTSGGYITSDTILNSSVYAREDIVVNSKKGYVNGGHIVSATAIKVKNAGSEMGTKTTLEVGVEPQVLSELKNLELKMEWVKKKMEGSLPMIEFYGKKLKRGEKLPPEKLLQFKIITLAYKKHFEELKDLQEKYETLNESISQKNGGYVEIYDNAYPGVKIIVVDAILLIKNLTKASRFIRDGADVKLTTLL